MKVLYIGIDPGSNTGVALWRPKEKHLVLEQFTSHCAAMFYLYDLLRNIDPSTVKFRIEDARLSRKKTKHLAPNPGKLQGVGYVKAYSKDWEAFCTVHGYDLELLAPRNTKVSPEYFERLTGIKTLKTQSHKRDSGMLVYGI